MSDGYKLTFTIVGILVVGAAVVMAATKRDHGHSLATIKIGPFTLELTGVGATMAAVGLAAMTIPWALAAFGIDVPTTETNTVLNAREHPASEYQICQAPVGSFVVVENLPSGPLAVRIGAAKQYLEIDALNSGTDGLRFDECVQRHDGVTAWWRIDGGGWLFSRYVAPA